MASLLNFTVLLERHLSSYVDSFNYAFESGEMSISQKRGIKSLIPKKDKDKRYLKNLLLKRKTFQV